MSTDSSKLKTHLADFLEEVFDHFRTLHIIPLAAHKYSIKVGHDYYGGDISRLSSFIALEKFIENEWESRFQKSTTNFSSEFAANYIFHLVNFAVLESRSYQNDYRVCDELTSNLSDKLNLTLSASEHEVRTIAFIKHLQIPNALEFEIQDTKFDNFLNRRHREQELVDRLPAAILEVNQTKFPHGEFVACTIESSFTASAHHPAMDANISRINRVMLSLQLLTGSTAAVIGTISAPVNRLFPTSAQWTEDANHTFFDRIESPCILTQDLSKAAELLLQDLDSIRGNQHGYVTTPLGIAMTNYRRAQSADWTFDAFVMLCTALEATLLEGRNDRSGITDSLAHRSALLLSTDDDETEHIATDVRTFYKIRSIMVHGGDLKDSKLMNLLGQISTVPPQLAQSFIGVAVDTAIHRLRDLTRRALLCRIMLACQEESVWKFGEGLNFEPYLLNPEKQRTLRLSWQNRLASFGYAPALNRNIPIDGLAKKPIS